MIGMEWPARMICLNVWRRKWREGGSGKVVKKLEKRKRVGGENREKRSL